MALPCRLIVIVVVIIGDHSYLLNIKVYMSVLLPLRLFAITAAASVLRIAALGNVDIGVRAMLQLFDGV